MVDLTWPTAIVGPTSQEFRGIRLRLRGDRLSGFGTPVVTNGGWLGQAWGVRGDAARGFNRGQYGGDFQRSDGFDAVRPKSFRQWATRHVADFA